MERGEIWWAKLPAPAGTRPVLLLTRNRGIAVRNFITVAELTRTIRNIPSEVLLGSQDGLPVRCVVNLDVINTIPKDLLTERICRLQTFRMVQAEGALKFALGIG